MEVLITFCLQLSLSCGEAASPKTQLTAYPVHHAQPVGQPLRKEVKERLLSTMFSYINSNQSVTAAPLRDPSSGPGPKSHASPHVTPTVTL